MLIRTRKRIRTIVIAAVMVLSLAVPSLAAVGTAGNSATKGGAVDPRQANSSETATVTMGKILTVNQEGKFPMIQDFNYEMTRINAWANDNTSTTGNGQVIPKASMPMPAAVATEHRAVTIDGDVASIQVGNFRDSQATSIPTGLTESSTVKGRTTPVSITFDRAGYYVYKVKEIGSTPVALDKAVPGVDYDTHEYFMVFYVNNRQDAEGNTIDGVYVSNITSYRNESGKEDYKPDLSDIAVTADNGGVAASANTRDNLRKVGLSSTDNPNRLEAYRFWNDQFTHDVVLTNNVKGALGDRNKLFQFTVTLTGLEAGQVYTINVPTTETPALSSSVLIDSATVGTMAGTKDSITADASGAATFLVKMKDDDKLVINALPVTSRYAVSEAESDHVASYTVGSAETGATIAKTSAANNVKGALATSTEVTDKADGTVHIDYVNVKDLQTITGLGGAFYPLVISAIVLLAALVLFMRRRGSYGIEEL